MGRAADNTAFACAFETNLGWIAIAWTGNRLDRFTLGHPSGQAALAAAGGQAVDLDDAPPPMQSLAERLQAYSAGDEVGFDDIQLDLSGLTAFQRRVVELCRRIDRGATLTYGQLAALAGSPGAARAVGSVMSRNRFPIVVPCHRVVGSGGSLGGFSAGEGVSLKSRMLRIEGYATASGRRRPLA